ncbi:hypothetical protein RF55_17380, partial [Lasius niger]
GFLWCSGRNLPRTKGNTLRLRGSASPSQSPSLTLDTKSRFCCVSNNAARIQLPHFTGKYEDWPAFRDLFQSIIGKDRNLSEVEKLHYLKNLRASRPKEENKLQRKITCVKTAWEGIRLVTANPKVVFRVLREASHFASRRVSQDVDGGRIRENITHRSQRLAATLNRAPGHCSHPRC